MADSVETTHGSLGSYNNQSVTPLLPWSGRIPADIMYCILKNISSDCNRSPIVLVCRDWYESFTTYHPPDLSIYSRRSLNSLLAECKRGNECARRRLEHTTSLRISQRDNDPDHYCASALLVLGSLTPGVHTISFFGSIRPPIHPNFARSLRQFKGLRNLEISHFITFNFIELRDMIISCPQLDTLVLRGGSYIRRSQPWQVRFPALPRAPALRVPGLRFRQAELRHLHIDLLNPLLQWLATSTPKLVPAVFKDDGTHIICGWKYCWEHFAHTKDATANHVKKFHLHSAANSHTQVQCDWEGCGRFEIPDVLPQHVYRDHICRMCLWCRLVFARKYAREKHHKYCRWRVSIDPTV